MAEDLQVADQMSDHKANENNSRDRHEEFAANGGAEEVAEKAHRVEKLGITAHTRVGRSGISRRVENRP